MKEYSIISYKINKGVKPIDVIQELECLMQKHNVTFSDCLVFTLKLWR